MQSDRALLIRLDDSDQWCRVNRLIGTYPPALGSQAALIGTYPPALASQSALAGRETPALRSPSVVIGREAPMIGSQAIVIETYAPTVGSQSARPYRVPDVRIEFGPPPLVPRFRGFVATEPPNCGTS